MRGAAPRRLHAVARGRFASVSSDHPAVAVAVAPATGEALSRRGLRLESATLGRNVVGLFLDSTAGLRGADTAAGFVIVFHCVRAGRHALRAAGR